MSCLPDAKQLLTKRWLEGLKRRAIRFKAWFKLDAIERAVVDLTIRVVERVRSPTLARALARVVDKLKKYLKPTFKERALTIGRVLAERVARIAQALGRKDASSWVDDPGFALYLGVSWLNTSPIYRPQL